MAVVIVHQGPGLTQESYEAVVGRLTGGKQRMESAADWPAEGMLVHTAGEAEGGFCVVDVWESEEAVRRFAETLMPILQEVGIEAEPQIYPAHTFISA